MEAKASCQSVLAEQANVKGLFRRAQVSEKATLQ